MTPLSASAHALALTGARQGAHPPTCTQGSHLQALGRGHIRLHVRKARTYRRSAGAHPPKPKIP